MSLLRQNKFLIPSGMSFYLLKFRCPFRLTRYFALVGKRHHSQLKIAVGGFYL
jgi:hypothetical protein